MATFNYPYTVASNEPMPSFGILDRSGTPIQNPFRGFANLFDADPNTPGVQIFNTNPNRNVTSNQSLLNTNVSNSIPTASSFSMGNFPKNRRSLLRDSFNYQNPFRGDEMTGSFQNVGNAVTSRFGGGTIANPTYPNASILNQRARVQNNQNNTGLMTQPNTGFASQGQELASQGLLNQQGQQRQTNQEPKQKGLLQRAFDKAMDFATSDYGRDFFAGIDAGYSKMPKTFMQSIQPGIQYADAKQQQKIENEIAKLRTKTDNFREPVYRALVRDKNGKQYGLFSSKGQLYADVNGVKIPQQELEKVIGPYDIRNVGDQMDGVISFTKFRELNKEIIDDEISLKKYVSFLQEVDKTGVGYERLINSFSASMKTFFSTKAKEYELSEEELAQQIAQGKLQGLLGSSRKEVVGGGVLTEQDARRIIEYLGGDITAFNNPARVRDAISYIFREKYNKYLNNLNDYNIGVQNEYGTRGYKTKEQIKFTDPQLSLIDAGITTELGLRDFNSLSQDELLSIDPNNLDLERYNEYIKALERFVE